MAAFEPARVLKGTFFGGERGHKEAILADPRILSGSQSVPPGSMPRAAIEVSWEGKNPGDQTPFFPVPVDSEYLKTFRLEMAEGRFFSAEMATDRTEAAGLASFITEKRTKEIGIRKVLGASARGLVLMQSRAFLAWVLAANAVALPAAYLAAGRYRAEGDFVIILF